MKHYLFSRIGCITRHLKIQQNGGIRNNVSFQSSHSSSSTSNNSETSTDLVTVDQLRGIRIIGINRPEKVNCVNHATAEALLQAFKDFDQDENSKVAVLHGVGGNFCSGYDLKELSSVQNIISKTDLERGPMGPTQYETSKPVIAAIDGYAVAGGMELALWCDVRIVEETAIMGVFCRRWGVPLIDGGTARLPAIVGLGRALDLILTGRPIRAQEALQIGLANQICACGTAIGRAVFYAEALEKYPQGALKADRLSARQAFSSPSLMDALKTEYEKGIKVLQEGQVGATQFSQGDGRHGSYEKFKADFSDEDYKS